MCKSLTLAGLLLLSLLSASAATYYVDFDSGDDTAAGTSTSEPWKTLPGSRNVGDTDYVSSTWGGTTITSANKVPAGTVFKLRRGTSWTSSDGGKILINNNFYASDATLENPITFEADQTWGSGAVVFDGDGMTLGGGGFGIIHINTTVNAIKVNGAVTNGIVFQNSPYDGISQYPNVDLLGPIVWNCFFTNNGTSYAVSENASDGQIRIRRSLGGSIYGCTFDGNGNKFQAVGMSDNGLQVTNYTVSHCTAYNHAGDNDGGIAFKAPNSFVTWSNVIAHSNYKGWDLGEESATSAWEIDFTLINCSSYSNNFGINFNSVGFTGTRTGNSVMRLINCLVYDNSEIGSKVYAGPFEFIAVHSVWYRNGQQNITAGRDGLSDTNTSVARIYNSILAVPLGSDGNIDTVYWSNSGDPFTLDADYNAYVQRTAENFYETGGFGGGSDVNVFTYGANGPGHASGNWYAWQSWNNDANSKGTGATDTTLPPLNYTTFVPTNSYAGLNISGESWYVPAMGVDRAGRTRTSWDIGAFEFQATRTIIATNFNAGTVIFGP